METKKELPVDVEGLEGDWVHWSRVPVGAAGATFLLTVDAAGGHAHVVAGAVRVAVSAPDGAAATLAAVPVGADAVVYAKVRERGVSLLVGERHAAVGSGAPELTYTRHYATGASVSLAHFRAARPQRRRDTSSDIEYSLPARSTELARYGARAACALAGAETASWSTGVAPPDVEPCGAISTLPRDAMQVAHFIAQALQ